MPFASKIDKELRPQVRKLIMQLLYAPEDQSSKEILDGIIRDNCKLDGHSIYGFHYMFQWYDLGVIDGTPSFTPQRGVHVPLHQSLRDRMEAWVEARKKIQREERTIVEGYLTAVLNMSDSPYDWLRLIPDEVKQPLNDLINWGHIPNPLPPVLTEDQVEAFYTKQERFLNVLKGRLALNLIF